MNISNSGFLLKGTNFNLQPKLYFDSALPENAMQKVGGNGCIFSIFTMALMLVPSSDPTGVVLQCYALWRRSIARISE